MDLGDGTPPIAACPDDAVRRRTPPPIGATCRRRRSADPSPRARLPPMPRSATVWIPPVVAAAARRQAEDAVGDDGTDLIIRTRPPPRRTPMTIRGDRTDGMAAQRGIIPDPADCAWPARARPSQSERSDIGRATAETIGDVRHPNRRARMGPRMTDEPPTTRACAPPCRPTDRPARQARRRRRALLLRTLRRRSSAHARQTSRQRLARRTPGAGPRAGVRRANPFDSADAPPAKTRSRETGMPPTMRRSIRSRRTRRPSSHSFVCDEADVGPQRKTRRSRRIPLAMRGPVRSSKHEANHRPAASFRRSTKRARAAERMARRLTDADHRAVPASVSGGAGGFAVGR